MAYGWSTLGFGCELWPWRSAGWAEQVEGQFLRTILGVGQSTNYLAICWFTGCSPVQDRIWIKAVGLLVRMGRSTQSLESQALTTQFELWDNMTSTGRLSLPPSAQGGIWFYGFFAMLRTIGWGESDEDRIRVANLRGKPLLTVGVQIIQKIKATRTDRLYAKLVNMNKYSFLLQCCPQYGYRQWLTGLPRWSRKAPARLFLSQHRLVIETGRWKRWPRKLRTCAFCVQPVCKTHGCTCRGERCIGTEAHVCWFCPGFRHHWDTIRSKIETKYGIYIGNDFKQLNDPTALQIPGSRSIEIGTLVARYAEDLLFGAELIAIPYTTLGLSLIHI